MIIVDANIVLRYLLNDVREFSEKATDLLENNEVLVPNEVIAEIVYVLEKVYHVENKQISSALIELFDYRNIKVNDHEILIEALLVYAEKKLDFVDTLLFAYHTVRKHEIYTFDKKLNRMLKIQKSRTLT